ncbi:MAG: hypothetical protein HYU64_05295 [Armatimonadetes bacterium]|nr:hypothetical protein [Armatimonadota bacterium]
MAELLPEIQRNTPWIDARYSNQVRRYNQGVENGTIDATEQEKLKKADAGFKGQLYGAKTDDGLIDLQERIGLHKTLNRTSAMIFKFKHDTDPVPET